MRILDSRKNGRDHQITHSLIFQAKRDQVHYNLEGQKQVQPLHLQDFLQQTEVMRCAKTMLAPAISFRSLRALVFLRHKRAQVQILASATLASVT